MVLLVEDAAGGWAPLLLAPASSVHAGGRGAATTTATTGTTPLLAAAAAHAGLAAAAAAFLARSPTLLPATEGAACDGGGRACLPAVCVLQGEVAFVPAAAGCTVGSADATTCVIAACASPAGVSVAHCDAGTATPSALDQLLAPHVGGGRGGRVSPRHAPPPVSLYLLGGAAVGPSTGADAGPAVADALLRAADARPEPLRLGLALLGDANTSANRHPQASSLALRTGAAGTATPFPATFTDRGPAVPLRLARLWAQGSVPEGEGGLAAGAAPPPPPRRLVPLVRSAGAAGRVLELAVPPLGGCGGPAPDPPPGRHGRRALAAAGARSRSPLSGSSGPGSAGGRLTPLASQAAALASLPDADLLAAASTSPASEPAHFVADLRAALSVLREDGGDGGGGGGDGGGFDGGAGVYRWTGERWARA